MSALASFPSLEALGRISLRERLEGLEAHYDTPSRRWYLAEIDDVPAAGVWALHGVHPILETPDSMIVAVGTVPSQRGAGHARAVLDWAQQQLFAEGAQAVRLFVHPGNRAANALYQAIGFRSTALELTLAPSPDTANHGDLGV